MKVTIYTTTECPFSKQEKEYLAAQNIAYEERNVETNREYLTEMLAVSNNFAGTPVSKIEKDDGAISILKGFTKEEFDTALGVTQTIAEQPVGGAVAPAPIVPQLDSTAIPAPFDVPTTPTEPIVPSATEPVVPAESVAAEAVIDTGTPPVDPTTPASNDSSVPVAPVADDQQVGDSATTTTPPSISEPDVTLPPAPGAETPAPIAPTTPVEEPKSEEPQASPTTDMSGQPPVETAAQPTGSPQDSLNDILANLENKSTAQSLSDTPTPEPVAPSVPSDTQPPEAQTPSPTEPPTIPDPKF